MNNKSKHTKGLFDRRDFLKTSATGLAAVVASSSLAGCAGLGQFAPAPAKLFAAKPTGPVKVGFVGVGNQGSGHVLNLLKIEDAQITAICDIIPEKAERAKKWITDAGQPEPALYTRGEYDFVRMCETEDLDLVYTATPWRWHVPVMVAAMKNQKHAATEVPAAITIEECWQMVETAEKTKRHCVIMENCCYDYTELMILNMVRKGLFGELLHAECGYLHDLRHLKLSSSAYQGMWRVYHSLKRNADLYPTHGLGPISQCMNINRGNQYDYLVSMSSQSRGLNLYAEEHLGADNEWAKKKYALGDVVNTLIKTVHGQTILITHDTNTPRPYSRKVLLQGTKGVVRKYPEEKIHIEGRSKGHGWENLDAYKEEFEHPLWKAMAKKSKGAGHGGMDFIEDYRLIECISKGLPTDMNVYDAAAWSAVIELSEKSIKNKGQSVKFPDFTRGKWKNYAPLGIIEG